MLNQMPPQAMPQPPMGQPMGPQGVPPQIAQMIAMLQQRQQGGPQGQPIPPGAMPNQPPGMPQRPGFTPQQMGAMGRFGDSLVAHLSPGEVEIPPQIQTPQLMAAIRQAFAKAGVSPAQFTAGSPQSSHNPATGAPEYNLFSSMLPMLLGGAAAFFAPELLPALGASGAFAGGAGGAALAGGLGSAAGRALTGGNLTQDLMAGAGGAAGGYAGAGGLGGSSGAGPSMMPNAVSDPGAMSVDQLRQMATANAAGLPFKAAANGAGGFGAGLGAAAGAGLGSQLSPNPVAGGPQLPSGFDTPMGPLNRNYGQLLGSNQATSPVFTNYNPVASVTGPNPGYNFYPVQPPSA